MTLDHEELFAKVAESVRQPLTPALRCLASHGARNLVWYLTEKIANAPQADVWNNSRPLKYAYNFVLNDAFVTFVRERNSPTPDLEVRIRGWVFYLEVRKLETNVERPTAYPADKLVYAVVDKKRQLPLSAIGFVAVDNMDLAVESDPEAGFTHRHISDGLDEIARLAEDNPSRWSTPSGVIVAAHTTGGAFSRLPVRIPHYLWVNEQGRPGAPPELVDWICSSLPDGEVFDVQKDSPQGLSLQGRCSGTITEVTAE